MKLRRISVSLLIALGLSLMPACGGGTSDKPQSQAPVIAAQPQDQSVPLSQTATFTVTATGTAPLSYQWSRNDVAIPGATSSSYTTSTVTTADDGAGFTVRVTNAAGSVASRSAMLKVGPRSPRAGDLRFRLVSSAFTVNGYGNTDTPIHTNLLGRLGQYFTNWYGTPLSIGANCESTGSPYNCIYFFTAFPLPIGMPALTTKYDSDTLDAFDTRLAGIVAPGTVINSVILEPANNDFAIASIESPPSTGFDYLQKTLAITDLQTYATQQGLVGRVITAVSFDAAGDVFTVSYGWGDDPTTVYEAKVARATIDTIRAEATNLADQGYIITAMGAGNDSPDGVPADGYVLVGTRVEGDTLPRSLKVVASGSQKPELWDQGYAIVGYVVDPDGFTEVWIGER